MVILIVILRVYINSWLRQIVIVVVAAAVVVVNIKIKRGYNPPVAVVVVTVVKFRNFGFWKFSDFFNFGKLRYYYNNKGRYNPPVGVVVVP